MADCVEFDLVSSQLVILAELWNISEVREFLDGGGNIWASLFNHFGLDDEAMKEQQLSEYELIKGVFKGELYAICYGRYANVTRQRLRCDARHFDDLAELRNYLAANKYLERCGEDPAMHLLAHPVVESLVTAKTRRMKEVRSEGFVVDCFGNPVTVSSTKEAKSALAQQAQAMEMYLLMPVVDIAKSRQDFHIVLWSHDGFSIKFNHNRQDRQAARIREIKEAIDKRATERNVPVTLDVTYDSRNR